MFDDVKYPEPDPNKKPAAEVWNKRYEGDGFLFGKEPVMVLKNHLKDLRPGKAFDVAMGEGRNSVFLAKNGFQVDGIDASKVAIEKANRLAEENGVSIGAKTQNMDFFLMPLMKYDTVVMTYFRPVKRFFSEIRRGLVLGGTFALEAYLTDHIRHAPQPNPNLDFEDCYRSNEVLGLIKDFRLLYFNELKQGDSYLVQCIAQKHNA